ncbi:MAG: peptide MFS transporter [Betaproteobacteria bacterium]|nr:peptide MFS transporter [Betaproteobacteria bacterium]
MSTVVNTIPDVKDASPSERHPPALSMLFFTEMWERFSYYGMRALLVLYLVNSVGYERKDALALYAVYTGLVYLTPILGGYLADRYLGQRKAILIGGIVMALGHFAMAFPALLNLALGLLIIGNGFFKPNMATMVGSLYRENDPRRDGGFTIYYMGVNLGAFLAPLVAGTLGEKMGWHWGFAAAGFGMCFGLAQFLWGQHKLGNAGFPAGKDRLDKQDWVHILLISLAMIPLVYMVITLWGSVGPLWNSLPPAINIALPVACFVGFLIYAQRSCAQEEWHSILAIMILGVFVVFFWMGFEQAGGTMNLFADKQTDRMVLGWEIPASIFQAINPLAIVALGPVFSMMWIRLDQSRFALSTPAKMGVGMIVLGLGFVVLAIAQGQAEVSGKVGPQWLVIVYVLHTMGELCLSPVGLSMVTKLAPVRLAALMMGIWYTANAIANYLAGVLENLLAQSAVPLYWFLVGSSVGAGVLLLLLTPILKKLMHGKG